MWSKRAVPNTLGYSASKAALANLTLSFSRLLAPKVKVNSLAPSLIMFNEGDSEAYREKTLKKSLRGIEPGVEVAVQTLQFLLDNPYITGRSCRWMAADIWPEGQIPSSAGCSRTPAIFQIPSDNTIR